MSEHAEGTAYRAGETIVRQGEIGECMFVIQEGEVEVVRETDGDDVRLAVLGVGDFFEMIRQSPFGSSKECPSVSGSSTTNSFS